MYRNGDLGRAMAAVHAEPFKDLEGEVVARMKCLATAVPDDVELCFHWCDGEWKRKLKLSPETELILGLVHNDGAETIKKCLETTAKYASEFGIATELASGVAARPSWCGGEHIFRSDERSFGDGSDAKPCTGTWSAALRFFVKS